MAAVKKRPEFHRLYEPTILVFQIVLSDLFVCLGSSGAECAFYAVRIGMMT